MGDRDDVHRRERDRVQRQSALDARKTSAERNRLGQFATPPGLADELILAALAQLPPDEPVRFLDPAFGTGAFYSSLLRCGAPQVDAAVGYELDPHYGKPARELWAPTGLDLRLADFTTAAPDAAAKFNLVVCNPPYVRHHYLTAEQKQRLRAAVVARTGVNLHGFAGLYCHFLLLSLAWMTRDGIGAWLIPSEFMDVNYGAAVKGVLLDRVSLLHVHRFDLQEKQFGDALVSSAVVLFRNTAPRDGHSVRFSYGHGVTAPGREIVIARDELRRTAKWTSLPARDSSGRAEVERPIVAHAASMREQCKPREPGVRLGELFAIRRGVVTGANSFFVLTAEQAAARSLPREFLRPMLPGPRLLETDEVEADEQGAPVIERPRYLLDCRLPPEVVAARYPTLWAYLQRGVAAGVPRGYLCSRREPWYAQEQRPPAAFLCTYMGRVHEWRASPFRVILNHSRALAVNVYLLLYPRPPFAALLGDDPGRRRAVWSALRVIAGERIIGQGRVYGGGLHKLEPRELGNAAADLVLEALADGRWFGAE